MSGHPRTRAVALLSAAVEGRLGNVPLAQKLARVSPWDVWWACARADLTAAELGLDAASTDGQCSVCAIDVQRLTGSRPLQRPDPDAWPRCGCLAQWARAMRSPFTKPGWPPWRVTLAVIKPSTDTARAERLLAETFTVLTVDEFRLTAEDPRRLYPDSYGGPFRARVAAYLTSEPVRVLVLLAEERLSAERHHAIKRGIRRQLGVGDDLRNHVHLADNPGEAWCDVMHLAGPGVAQQLYERFEREHTIGNLEVYRDLLAWWTVGADAHHA